MLIKFLLDFQIIHTYKPNPGLIIHSDKGSQFRAKLYRRVISDYHLVYSYTSLGHSYDKNAAQESFHSLLKKERLFHRTLDHFSIAKMAICEYVEGVL